MFPNTPLKSSELGAYWHAILHKVTYRK
uniref:Uncharacterized protein n=1 Tax=Anguilla anguilla TaxID=7936 RepID=A0A0E9RT02_ANGAN